MPSKVMVYYTWLSLFIRVASHFVVEGHNIGHAEVSSSYLQPTHLSIFFRFVCL